MGVDPATTGYTFHIQSPNSPFLRSYDFSVAPVSFERLDDPMEEVDELCNIKEMVYGVGPVTYRIMPYEWDTELSRILYRRGVKEVSIVRESGELHVYTRTEEERWATYRTVPQE